MPDHIRHSPSFYREDDLKEIKQRLDKIEEDLSTLLAIHRGVLLFAYVSKWAIGVVAGIATVWAMIRGIKP